MNIPISNEVATILLVLFTMYMFYLNWGKIQILSSVNSKMLYSAVIFAEISIIVGSRFFAPPIIQVFVDRASPLYNIFDFVVFFVVLFSTLKVGAILKDKLD